MQAVGCEAATTARSRELLPDDPHGTEGVGGRPWPKELRRGARRALGDTSGACEGVCRAPSARGALRPPTLGGISRKNPPPAWASRPSRRKLLAWEWPPSSSVGPPA